MSNTPRSLCAPINGERIEALMSAERAAVILVDRDSRLCERFLSEVEELTSDGLLHGLAISVVTLGTPAAAAFECAINWLDAIEAVPYVALYRRGLRVGGFVAFRASSLLARLNRLAFLPALGDLIATRAFVQRQSVAA